MSELKGSETDRFLKFFAILNTLLEEKKLGRILVGGFAAEIYSGRGYRTGDVDIIIEGGAGDLVKQVLKEISDRGLRIYLPKIREISEKGIDIVGDVYTKRKPPIRMQVDSSYYVYILPPEEVIITYLEAWKFWNSTEDRIKAVLVYLNGGSKGAEDPFRQGGMDSPHI
ncbi:hypothetical protein IC007_2459 [Sulfuracidifex tepidarius]|uniref:Uncharacterized protein n=1 Tax=Sulfuracidifex tepidarius TaxID=1294262 RepID=A0A510E5W9_9CREN|nr:hypothetical protein IC007_2459 [Sulfuracidifex tepidarius]